MLTWGIAIWLLSISVATGKDYSSEKVIASSTNLAKSMPINDFACIGSAIVTLDANCEAILEIPMVLKGTGVESLEGYTIAVIYENGSRTLNKVVGHGTFQYEVYDDNEEFVCQGNIKAEDKTAPRIKAPTIKDTLVCTDIDSILNVGLYDFDNLVWKRLQQEGVYSIKDSVYDNCTSFDHLEFVVEDHIKYIDQPCEEIARISRFFQVRDEKNNVSRLDSIIFVFLQPDIELDEIKEDVEINVCTTDETPYVLSVEEAGAPYFINGYGDTLRLYDTDTTLCDYGIALSDDSVAINCGFKLIRNWTITNWCTEEVVTHQQTIKYGDLEAPEVFCRQGILDARFSTAPFKCAADIKVPRPSVRDNCGNTGWTYSVEIWSKVPETDQFGVLTGDTIVVKLNEPISGNSNDGYIAMNVSVGEHFFYYYVVDKCGNAAEVTTCLFEVFDGTPPSPVCVDLLNVSLGGKGIATVDTDDIDEGSSDNCSLEKLELRRQIKEECLDSYVNAAVSANEGDIVFADLEKDANADIWRFDGEIIVTRQGMDFFSAYAEKVIMTCCDVGRIVSIELRVTDKAGNSNSCWSIAQVEDKIAPQCRPPQDVVVDCDTTTLDRNNLDDIDQLQRYFGTALANDNCSAVIKELEPSLNIGDCSIGTITRSFIAEDPSGNQSGVCRQTITIQGVFDYEIAFPADEDLIQCGGSAVDTVVDIKDNACGLFAINVDVKRLRASGDACYKDFRTYTIINWCEYDGITDPMVISRDEDNDRVPGEKVFLLRRRDGNFFIDDNRDETDGFLRTGNNSTGFWTYTQHIRVYDNEAPTIEWPTETEFCSFDTPENTDDICTGEVHLSFTVDDLCTPERLSTRVLFDEFDDGAGAIEIPNNSANLISEGNTFTFRGVYPIGTHSIKVTVFDDCGNFTVRTLQFEVIDCKAPTIICTQGLSVPLMPMDMDGNGVPDFGMAVVPAESFVASESFDCSGGITFSINRKGETPDRSRTELMVNCLDPLNETIPIEVYAWDASGNRNGCETFVIVTDNRNLCSGGVENGIVAGHLLTQQNLPLSGATVRLSGTKNSTVRTDVNGAFQFVDLEEGKDYTITPESLENDYINGVSTYDLVLISKHILGVDLLESPYQIIAADINGSKSVTTLDLIHLRKLILSVTDTFPDNTSWRFISSDYQFPDQYDPWVENIPEFKNINNLLGTEAEVNFVAVKVGDINQNVRVGESTAFAENRSVENPLHLSVADKSLESGRSYTIPITAKNLSQFVGGQFTISFDPEQLQLDDLSYALLQKENVGLNYFEDGLITVSWNTFDAQDDESLLISLGFTALRTANFSDLLSINSRITNAEAYAANGEFRNIQLQFEENTTAASAFRLHQNYPNPFKDQTMVAFNLPEPSEVLLSVYDANGQLILQRQDYYEAGENQIVLKKNNLKSGVLYYHLQTNNYQASKKMVLID